MKIILTTETSMTAIVLKSQIVSALKGEHDGYDIDTWSYIKSGDGYDIVFHNPTQYVDSQDKNVIFRVEVDGEEVVLTTAWWKTKQIPSREILCLHVGRLTEMLLRYFSESFIKFGVVGY